MLPYEYIHHVRVRYAETDQMGICWHGNYVLYLEEARTEALRHTGFGSYADIEKTGVMTALVHLDINYHKPALYDEVLAIKVTVSDPVRSKIRFHYDVTNEAGDRIITATTDLAFVSAGALTPCRPPAVMREFFK